MRFKVLAISIAIISIYGCNEKDKNSQVKQIKLSPTVTAFNIKESQIEINKDFKAKVVPLIQAEIRPQISGIIVSKLSNDGDYVIAGQTLYKVDDSNYKAIYEQNLASLNSAKVDLENSIVKNERYKKLLKEKGISKQEKEDVEVVYKKMKSTVEERMAALKLSEINLGYTNIKSPIDGIMGISNITQGSLVTTNQPEKINTVTKYNPIYLEVDQSSDEFFEMKKYMKEYTPVFNLKDMDYEFKGNLISTELNVNQSSDSLKIRAEIENPNNALLPGMFVNVSIVYGIDKKAIIVPQKSVSFNSKGKPYVFIIKNKDGNNTVENKEIKISNYSLDNNWIVKEGLNDGDRVVFDGFDKIKSGDIVNVAEIKEQGEN